MTFRRLINQTEKESPSTQTPRDSRGSYSAQEMRTLLFQVSALQRSILRFVEQVERLSNIPEPTTQRLYVLNSKDLEMNLYRYINLIKQFRQLQVQSMNRGLGSRELEKGSEITLFKSALLRCENKLESGSERLQRALQKRVDYLVDFSNSWSDRAEYLSSTLSVMVANNQQGENVEKIKDFKSKKLVEFVQLHKALVEEIRKLQSIEKHFENFLGLKLCFVELNKNMNNMIIPLQRVVQGLVKV